MAEAARHETEWQGLRLVIEQRPYYFHAVVYDPDECEVLFTAERMSFDAAKFAAVDFVSTARFGPSHDLKPEVIAAMLTWESA